MANAHTQVDDDPIAAAEALLADGQARKAAQLLQQYRQKGRGGLLLVLTLQKMLLASGDIDDALILARETARTNPQVAAASLGLGEALLAAGQLPSSIGEFQRALRLDPQLWTARYALGRAWLEAGEAGKALAAFAEIPEEIQADGMAQTIADAKAVLARPRSDARYIRHLFDQFSSDYDARMLGELRYCAPFVLRQMADLVGVARGRRMLDLGCGTGLAGEAFRELVERLDGVDLSPAMIEKARKRGIYDTLQICDLEEVLSARAAAYDLIVAADALVYLGDLAQVIAGAARTLFSGGFFLFTVEKADDEGFELGPKRRWRHSASYLRHEAGRAGLDIAGFLACHPRSEAGVPVEGFAVALRQGA